MSNMSYVRFENTLEDLQDCKDALDEGAYRKVIGTERVAMLRLIELCQDIADEFGDMDE